MKNERMPFKKTISNPKLIKTCLLGLLLLLHFGAFSTVRLPAIIADNMVLQQKTKITLWGWADAGERINISCSWQGAKAANVVADMAGNWKVNLLTAEAGGPYTINFKGNNAITVNNVMLGEVWFCSGQSNMQFTMGKGPSNWENGVYNAEQEIAKANYPKIRMFTVRQTVADSIRNNSAGNWQECNPQNAVLFSAVAYYYGRELFEKTGFPIGLINSTWGGTPAESWTNRNVLTADDDLNVIVQRYEKGLETYPQDMEKYKADFDQWKKDTSIAKHQHTVLPKAPPQPMGRTNSKSPYKLYNAMIAPLVPYTIKGFIWYQGESNADRAYQYRKLFPALIKSWRNDRRNSKLPFYFVQISPQYQQNPEIREAQLFTYHHVPYTGMVVTTDNGDSLNIHPRNKELVGKRLALWPLSHDYGFKDIVFSGPLYKAMKVENNQAIISFQYAEGGLTAKDGDLREFTIAGDDQKFYPAKAKIDGNRVIVWSDEVKKPVAVRFGWRNYLKPNLYNNAGLPASPFRTDSWRGLTEGIN